MTLSTFEPGQGSDDGYYYDSTFSNAESICYIGDISGINMVSFIRFPNVTISQGEKIVSAKVRFNARNNLSSDTVRVKLRFEAADNPTAPTSAADGNGRDKTAGKDWDFTTNWSATLDYWGPDISTQLQEVIDRGGWQSGNAIVLYIIDDGSTTGAHRTFSPYETLSGSYKRPLIEIEHYVGAIPIQPQTSTDDGEAYPSVIDFNNQAGWFGNDGTRDQNMYIRFPGVQIPAGAIITNAYISCTSFDNRGPGNPVEADIYFEDQDNAQVPVDWNDFDTKILTSAVRWTISETWTTGTIYNSPSLVSILQQVISRPGWQNGNALQIITKSVNTNVGEARRPRQWDYGDHTNPVTLWVDYITDALIPGNIFHGVQTDPLYLTKHVWDSISKPLSSTDDGHISGADIVVSDQNEVFTGKPEGATSYDGYIRFPGIHLEQGRPIVDAQAALKCSETNLTGVIRLQLVFEASDNATAPQTGDYSGRPVTSAVDWIIDTGVYINKMYTSPDISDILKEVTDRAGWTINNAVNLFIRDNGSDTGAGLKFFAYDYGVEDHKPALYASNVTAFYEPQASADDGTVTTSLDNTGAQLSFGKPQGNASNSCYIRFPNVNIPKDSTILGAVLRVQASETNTRPNCYVTVHFEDVADSAQITDLTDYNSRVLTPGNTIQPELWTDGEYYVSPEITDFVQAIVNKPGWTSGNAMTIHIKEESSTNNHGRRMHSFDGTGDPPALGVKFAQQQLQPNSMHLPVTIDNIEVTQKHYLEVDSISHSLSMDHIDWFNHPEDILCPVEIDNIELTQKHTLEVQNIFHTLFVRDIIIVQDFGLDDPGIVRHYTFTLTGTPNGLDDVIMPMTSFNSRLRQGESSYLNVVVPTLDHLQDVLDRQQGDLIITLQYKFNNQVIAEDVIASSNFNDFRWDRGGQNVSMTLSGYRQQTYSPKGVILRQSDLLGTSLQQNGKMRLRFAYPDINLNPGDTLQVGQFVIVVGQINHAVSSAVHYMDVTEA